MITTLEQCIRIQHARLSADKRWQWSRSVIRYLLREHKSDYREMKEQIRREARKLWLEDLEQDQFDDTEAVA